MVIVLGSCESCVHVYKTNLLILHQISLWVWTLGPNDYVKGPVQSKYMFISIDQLPKMIEFYTIIVHNYSSGDFILIFEGVDLMVAAILKNL